MGFFFITDFIGFLLLLRRRIKFRISPPTGKKNMIRTGCGLRKPENSSVTGIRVKFLLLPEILPE
jgi:hypothetical protein